jgi:colanic acid/amylovoran biosynthesis glycosyltransferase
MRKVAHIVRKLLPSTATFVRNQLMSHKRYEPCVVFKEYIRNTLSGEIRRSLDTYWCDDSKRGTKALFSWFVYKNPFERITAGDRKHIRNFLFSYGTDIAHLHYGSDAGVFIKATKNLGIPSIVSFYGYDCTSFPHWLYGYGVRYLRRVFEEVDYCLAMSEDMKDDLSKLGCPQGKIIVHYYGTDVSRFRYKRFHRKKPETIVLMVASLDEKKGHVYLLQSIAKLDESIRSKLRFRIVGNGPLEAELKQHVSSLNLDAVVTFLGSLEYLSERFLQEFRNADIFVHPSVVASNGDKEGIPGTIVEAMAAGLPVVSTYHAGIPYMIEHGKTGFLVEERDIDGLAWWITRLTIDSNLRMRIGKNAQKYALRNLDLKKKQIMLENIYDRVIEEHNTRC